MTIYNNINNISEDYTFILNMDELFYNKTDMPCGIYNLNVNNKTWTEIKTNSSSFDSTYQNIKNFVKQNYQTILDLISYDDAYSDISIKTQTNGLYIGCKTVYNTEFPPFENGQYFIAIISENLNICVPVKTFALYSNIRLAEQDDEENISDLEYLSAKQCLNLIYSAISKISILEIVDTLPTTNIRTNCVYMVLETPTQDDIDDGLNLNFKLYLYSEKESDPNKRWKQIDRLTFDIKNYALKIHTHGNISNDGTIGNSSGLPLITGQNGIISTGVFGGSSDTTATHFVSCADSRLSDKRAPKPHTHGDLQDNGQIGLAAQANKNVVTDGNGKITTEDKPIIPSASSTNTDIKMDGTQSAGSSSLFARADHVHPSDTSKLNKNLGSDKGNRILTTMSDGTVYPERKDILIPVVPTDISDLTDTTYIIPYDLSHLANDNGMFDVWADEWEENKTFLYKSDIVDNLITNDEDYVLSAKQGKVLQDNKANTNHTHGNITSDGKISENNTIQKNKNVVVNSDGEIVTANFTTTEVSAHTHPSTDIKSVKIAAPSDTVKSLNDVTETGIYYNDVNTECGRINYLAEANQAFFLFVENWGHSNSVKQTITHYNTKKTYTRVKFNGVWSDWVELAEARNIPVASDSNPLMNATNASAGNNAKFARDDHVHPTDTSRASKSVATSNADGLMSKSDKATFDSMVTKLSGIATNANNYSHPTTLTANVTNYSSNQEPSFGGTFNIPKLTFNTGGHLTTSANSTVKIPALPTAKTTQAGIIKIGTDSSSACAGDDSRLSDKREPTSHASAGTGYGISTNSAYGHAMATSTTPKMDGTATLGSETAKFARGDHIHPSDTNKIDTSTMQWKKADGTIMFNTSMGVLYYNDYFCYLKINKDYSSVTINTTSFYAMQSGFIQGNYCPPWNITAISDEGTAGRGVIVQLTPDGDLKARALRSDFTGAAIIKCSLFYPRKNLFPSD